MRSLLLLLTVPLVSPAVFLLFLSSVKELKYEIRRLGALCVCGGGTQVKVEATITSAGLFFPTGRAELNTMDRFCNLIS